MVIKGKIKPIAPNALASISLDVVPVELIADFDRSGSLDRSPFSPGERQRRIVRPGAILLPNLDIDDPLPSIPPGGAPPDLKDELDSKKDTHINGGNDQSELTPIVLRVSTLSMLLGGLSAVFKVASNDANRIRIFQVATGQPATAWPVVLGDGSASPTKNEFDVPLSLPDLEFLIEARTLPWHPDPTFRVPSDPVPNPPLAPPGLPFVSSARGVSKPANTTRLRSPIYSSRAPADVWVRIIHSVAGIVQPLLEEVGLFTIAPFILLSNLQPVEQVYAVYFPSDNHNFAYDLAEGCQAALGAGVTLPADTTTPFAPSTRGHTGPLYLADGARYNDQWMQDQFEMGYAWAPHAHMHVILHCKRGSGGPLAAFVRSELPGPGVGLFDSIHGPGNSLNFGGNLEVSPPVSAATPSLPAGPAGPAIPAQPAAPFGKILLGNSAARPVNPDFREFLKAQKVQPLLEIDTSWLGVGHVDEIISFVPATGGKGFKLLIASVLTAQRLLTQARAVPSGERTDLFRGKRWVTPPPRAAAGNHDARISVETLLSRAETSNDQIRQQKLGPILERLKRGLNLNDSDVIRIPVYFDPLSTSFSAAIAAGETTVAFTPGMVNLLVVNRHLMVPKPFAMRLKKNRVLKILRDGMGISTVTDARLDPLIGHWYWARAGENTSTIATTFGVTEADILNNPQNAGLTAGALGGWRRIWIPEDNVDLFEAYVKIVLEDVGCTVHFIDDWDVYHRLEGEVHCGTNARRTPPEAAAGYSGPFWWDFYEKLAEL